MRTSPRYLIRSLSTPSLYFWLFALLSVYYCGLNYNVDLDDAFIYFRIVNMVLDSGRPEFNIGDDCFMVTSPLWVFLLTGVKSVLPSLSMPEIAKILWMLFQLLAAWFAFRALSPRLGHWAPFICFPLLLPTVNSMMGNEIALLYTALFGSLWALFTRRPTLVGLFLGIGYLARGEFVFMSLVIVAHYAIKVRTEEKCRVRGGTTRELLIIAGMALLVAAVWHAYNLIVFQSFFPATLKAKIVQGQVGSFGSYQHDIWEYTRLLGLHGHTFLVALVVIGIIRQPYWALLAAIYQLCHALMYLLLGLPAYHWYYYDSYLFALFFLFFGLFGTLDLLRKTVEKLIGQAAVQWVWRKSAPIAGSLLVLLFTMWFIPVRVHTLDSRPIKAVWENSPRSERHATYRAVSSFLRQKLHERDVVLGPEVGIVSYYLQDHEIRDTNGLATPGLRPEQVGNYDYLVGRFEPRFLLLPLKTTDRSLLYDWHGRPLFYRHIFTVRPRAPQYVGNIYERQEFPPLLHALHAESRGSAEVRYTLIDGDPALFCQPPFETVIPVSGQSLRIDIDIGFSPKIRSFFEKVSRACNGVDVIISGLTNRGESEPLVSHHLDPFDGTETRPPQRITFMIPAAYSKLRIYLDPIDGNNAFDWIYMKAND